MGAGKSSLVLRFVKGQFFDFQARRGQTLRRRRRRSLRRLGGPQESTIGAAFLTQTVNVNDATVKFEIWYARNKTSVSDRVVYVASRLTKDFQFTGTQQGKSATTASHPCTTGVRSALHVTMDKIATELHATARRRSSSYYRVRHHQQRLLHTRQELGAWPSGSSRMRLHAYVDTMTRHRPGARAAAPGQRLPGDGTHREQSGPG